MQIRKLKLWLADITILSAIYNICIVFCKLGFIVPGYEFNIRTYIFAWIFSIAVISVSRFLHKIYNNIWRYAGTGTYCHLIISDAMAFVVLFILDVANPLLQMGFAFVGFISALNCLASLSARFLYQILYARKNASKVSSEDKNHRINIAIVGAGNIGSALATELENNPQAHYKVVCFIDVDKNKIGQTLNGLPIYGEDDDIIRKIKELPVYEIIIALPDIDGNRKSKLYNFYKQTGCKVKIYDYPFVDSNIYSSHRALREISIEDLLSRKAVNFTDTLSLDYYKGKTVLITGGGGSIGSELCRQIAKLSPKKLVIFDIYENNAYDIQQELKSTYGDKLKLEVYIGSVRDRQRLDDIFDIVKPNIVLHAAAHKHVPLMEVSPSEAIKNNVFGTYNTADMAEKYNVEKFVLISTDKAVNPTNIMGASKRLCEMIIQCRYDSSTQFVAVRFGNVLGSNGSVIPLFKKQISAGGPVTVTDKRIIRYFMTIPEASQLVLQAGAMAKKGELFVLNMGKPVKIYDLAEKMILLSGFIPGEDIKIVETGLRPGEKLYEELLMASENLIKTDNDSIFIENDKPLSRDEVNSKLGIVHRAVAHGTVKAIKDAVRATVPTYHDPNEVNEAVTINSLTVREDIAIPTEAKLVI